MLHILSFETNYTDLGKEGNNVDVWSQSFLVRVGTRMGLN